MKRRNEFQRCEAGNPTSWLRTEAVAIECRCGAPRRDGKSRPTGRESGECRRM